MLFAFPPRFRRMPHDIHVPGAIGGHRAPAVDPVRLLNDVALRFEGGPSVVQTRIEQRTDAEWRFRQRETGSVPLDMDASVSTDRDLRSANAARRNGARRLMIHLNRRRKCRPTIAGANVKHIAVRRIAAKVDQMNGSAIVDGGLWLDSAVGHALL